MITIFKLSKLENNISTDITKEDCKNLFGFITYKPVRIVGEWKDLKAETNFYGYFYGELVILTEKEHSKIIKRFNKWGSKDYKQLTKTQFLENLQTYDLC